MDIMKHVDVLDLVTVKLYMPRPGFIAVDVRCHDEDKQVVFDPDALKKLNEVITEKVKGLDPRHPNVGGYIKEFVGKMLSELYRSGLAVIEDIPESKEDPYEEIRKQYSRRR